MAQKKSAARAFFVSNEAVLPDARAQFHLSLAHLLDERRV